MRILPWLVSALAIVPCIAGNEALIVADEIPAMQVLARRLEGDERISSKIVKQNDLPASLADYQAVIMYVHGRLMPAVERACVDYANGGGRLIVLHHSISSVKRTNEAWFSFLGIRLPEGDPDHGGYQWIEPVTYRVVNLGPHFVTTNKVQWPEVTAYTRERESGAPTMLAAITLRDSEVYLNHELVGAKTRLLGLKYTGAAGKRWMQDRAGWYQSVGKGLLFYFQPGHSAADFENPVLSRMIVNAVIWQP